MVNKSILITSFVWFSGCVTSPKSASNVQPLPDRKAFDEIAIGETSDEVRKKFGEPNEINTEQYQGNVFQVLQYSDQKGQPRFWFSIDGNSKVAGKSYWLNPKVDETDFDHLAKTEFRGTEFTKRIPCQTWGKDVTYMSIEKGLFISTHDHHAVVFSWGSPALTELRDAAFKKACPALQDSTQSNF